MAALTTDQGMRWLCDWCFGPLSVGTPTKTTWINGVKEYHDPECWDASGDPQSKPPKPICSNCGKHWKDHCRAHLIPCCPGRCPAHSDGGRDA